MSHLEDLLIGARVEKELYATRSWIGPRPTLDAPGVAADLLAKLDLSGAPDHVRHLAAIDRAEAANLLAVILTESLAYGRQKARPEALASAKAALEALAADATYLTNLRLVTAPNGGRTANGAAPWSAMAGPASPPARSKLV